VFFAPCYEELHMTPSLLYLAIGSGYVTIGISYILYGMLH
jgi:hypothetical protein